jgi:hypothetical protein
VTTKKSNCAAILCYTEIERSATHGPAGGLLYRDTWRTRGVEEIHIKFASLSAEACPRGAREEVECLLARR